MFNNSWKENFPVEAVAGDKYKFRCIPCKKVLSCSHQGVTDVKVHCGSELHKVSLKSLKNIRTLQNYFDNVTETSHEKKVRKAEVMITNFLIQHNLPLATADHLGPLFREVFPDSKIANSYRSARTKTRAILNEAIGSHCHNQVNEFCKLHPYSVGTDGSSDTGTKKMNPVTVRIFDVNRSKVVTNHFLSMCVTSGEDCCKALTIFEAIEKAFNDDLMPWCNCISLSVDNTNAMVGKKNSVASNFLKKNSDIFISGCPCHLAHIAASHAHDSFSNYIKLNVENLCIDSFYWFDKSSKRKGKLLEYFEFCDQEFKTVLKHLSVRWLSLERCLNRILSKLPSLRSYFASEHFMDDRFQRLQTWFQNPLLEPALMFQSSAIQLFTNFNQLLQRDEPCIHFLKASMESLARRLANRIMKPNAMHNITSITQLDLHDDSIYKDRQDLFLGGLTRGRLNRLLDEGDISQEQYNDFYCAAFAYFKDSVSYIVKKFPLTNPLICNAVWIDVEKREHAVWSNVEYFLDRFSTALLLENIDHDKLFEEFIDYQSLNENLLKEAYEDAKVVDGKINGEEVFHYRVDVLWWHLAKMTVPETTMKRFKHIVKVAEIVIVIPHSNAEQERIFSIVRKNKTDARSSLSMEGTLFSILTVKSHYPESSVPCFKWKPDTEVLELAKHAVTKANDKNVEE